MKISEVAEMVDLPISTIRYYEKIGIIPDEYILREQNNYRNYASEIIHHLDVVKNCLAVGFSINDIQSMISKNGISKDEQTSIIKEKIAGIEDAQKKLEDSKQSLYNILELDITCEDGFGKYSEPVSED
ncbi:MerR family transcriptional regulator [Paenibacillus sp. 19GGS1-52]|uniref:helix-turn-helix domain-containing protein n=1 Tax=Paenibacillus sp. 19GGS1-52 TaxID=2758563 RepID=UPI001EFBA05F|nr:MerR family transcriptional regulator [Paenibacillus sp. 19GGS1-52]ULO04987.1 MerR family transcriptional regulator [Paenibacillus sp. 19GGS1-52]